EVLLGLGVFPMRFFGDGELACRNQIAALEGFPRSQLGILDVERDRHAAFRVGQARPHLDGLPELAAVRDESRHWVRRRQQLVELEPAPYIGQRRSAERRGRAVEINGSPGFGTELTR